MTQLCSAVAAYHWVILSSPISPTSLALTAGPMHAACKLTCELLGHSVKRMTAFIGK